MSVSFQNYNYRPPTVAAVIVTPDNRADIASLVGGSVIGGTLYIPIWDEQVPAPDGSYITNDSVNGPAIYDPAVFLASFVESIAGPGMVGSTGKASSTASLGINAVVDVVVPLKRPMVNSDYLPVANIIAGAGGVLAGARVVGIISWTPTAVTVRVQNTGLSAIASGGFTVGVIAAV